MTDTRPYIRLHDGMPEHPKTIGLSDAAFRLLVETWCLAARLKSPWLSKHEVAERLKPGYRARRQLVDEGLIRLDHGDWWVCELDGMRPWVSYRPALPARPPIDPELRRAVYIRDAFTCQDCGARGVRLTLDHIYPWSRGGEDTFENLRALCGPCNSRKGARI